MCAVHGVWTGSLLLLVKFIDSNETWIAWRTLWPSWVDGRKPSRDGESGSKPNPRFRWRRRWRTRRRSGSSPTCSTPSRGSEERTILRLSSSSWTLHRYSVHRWWQQFPILNVYAIYLDTQEYSVYLTVFQQNKSFFLCWKWTAPPPPLPY